MRGHYSTTTRKVGQFWAIALVALLVCASADVRAITVTEFPVLTAASGPQGIAVGADANLWFTEFGSNQVGRITTAGVVTEFPAGSNPFYIAAGPDGNLWFTEFNGAGKIGRITTAGVLAEFPIPGLSSSPIGIAAGPDGNLWFAEDGTSNNIGRITPAGVITEFPIPTANAGAWGLTKGSDNNLWFCENLKSRVGQITTAGVITEFPFPVSASVSTCGVITSGPDGNLWFLRTYVSGPLSGSSSIERVTTAGVFTEFPVMGGFFPNSLGTGPDGNLWFTGSGTAVIGRITTAGVITTFAVPAGGQSSNGGIVTGPDGNLWYTEGLSNKIARVTLGAAAVPPTIVKSFGAASIPLNGSTSLSFTINNPNAATTLTGVGFSDTLPAGLVVSTPNGLAGSCGGGTITATAGSGSVSLASATLASSASCTFSVNVTGSTLGTKNNTTGAVTSVEGGTGGTASASVTVAAIAPPTIVKSFGAASIALNGSTSLSFTISNPNAATTLSGVGFADTLPAGLVVSTPNGLAGSCGGGTITATAGSGSMSLTSATLAGSASCTFSVNVTGTTAGTQNNTTGAVTSVEGGAGGTASATVIVVGAGPPPPPATNIPTLQQSALWLLGLLILIVTASVTSRPRKKD
jgi:streptogramin lyase